MLPLSHMQHSNYINFNLLDFLFFIMPDTVVSLTPLSVHRSSRYLASLTVMLSDCIYQGLSTPFVSSRLLWEGEKKTLLSVNDFSSTLNGWEIIPYELLQSRHSYFIVLAALYLMVLRKRRCQDHFCFFGHSSRSAN